MQLDVVCVLVINNYTQVKQNSFQVKIFLNLLLGICS